MHIENLYYFFWQILCMCLCVCSYFCFCLCTYMLIDICFECKTWTINRPILVGQDVILTTPLGPVHGRQPPRLLIARFSVRKWKLPSTLFYSILNVSNDVFSWLQDEFSNLLSQLTQIPTTIYHHVDHLHPSSITCDDLRSSTVIFASSSPFVAAQDCRTYGCTALRGGCKG